MSKEIQVLFLDDEESIIDGVQRLFMREPYAIFATTSPEKEYNQMLWVGK